MKALHLAAGALYRQRRVEFLAILPRTGFLTYVLTISPVPAALVAAMLLPGAAMPAAAQNSLDDTVAEQVPSTLVGADADGPDFDDPDWPAIDMEADRPVDEALLEDLPSLQAFDEEPDADFEIAETFVEDVRYSVKIDGLGETGLNGEFRRLSALVKGEGKTATAAQVASRAYADRQLLERLLYSEGWYGAQIEGEVIPPDAGRMQVQLRVEPGRRYRWSSITLDLIPEEVAWLGDEFALAEGDPVSAMQVEEAEGALLHRLQKQGYPFAEIGVRDVVLSQSRPQASYFLTGDIGQPGVFGQVRLVDYAPFSDKHANVIARFRPGDPYDTDMVDDLRRALIATQQFGGVAVKPVDSGERDAEGRAVTDIEVLGNEGTKKLLAGQLGYSSREGIRLEGSWRHRSFLQPEGSLTTRMVLGTEEQRLGAALAMDNWGQRDRTLAFGADVANLTPPAYSAQTVDFNLSLSRLSTPIWQKRWLWSLGAHVGASRERASAPDETGERPHRNFLFASLPLMIGTDWSNDLLDPTTGWRLKLEVSPEISREGGHVETYARAFLGGSAYQSFGDKFVLAARARAGSIIGAGLDHVAPTRRLYAGGGGSVRGFQYQGIGLEGPNNKPIGGRSLFEGSIEGRYRFGDLGVVAFVDAGSVNAGSTPGFDDVRYGAGVGMRYYSSFGPMRFDIARAINRRPRDPMIAIYISIGQAF